MIKSIIQDICQYAINNNLCNLSQGGTSLYEINFKENNYPIIFVSPSSVNSVGVNVVKYSFTIYYLDRLLKDNSNDLDILNSSNTVLQKLINIIRNFDYVLKVDDNYQITNFADSSHLADNVAGAYVSLNVSVKNNIGNCDIDAELPNINVSTIIYQIKDINITKNGDYNVTYDSEYNALKEVNVNVNIDTDYFYQEGFSKGKTEGYETGYTEGNANGREEQKSLIQPIIITENGTYTNENGYSPINVNIDTDSYYNNGYNEGYVQGETEGYNDGFSEGFDEGVVNGKEEQKSLLESIKITENGIFDNENGYDEVTVEIDTQSYYDNGYNEGYSNGEINGIEQGKEEQKLLIQPITITENGTFTNENGYSPINVNLDLESIYEEGYNNGEVNGIEQGKEEQKSLLTSITITENGNYINENGYNEVIVNVGGTPKPKLPNGITLQGSTFSTIDLSNWDWSNVYDWGEMFADCTNLTEIQNFPTDVEVLATARMFSNCKKLTSIPQFDTSNVINMSYMFEYCYALTSLDLSSFNTSNVTNMRNMFNRCYALTSLDLSSFDTSNVTNMYAMFNNCENLTSLDLSSFDTSNVTDMSYMFDFCNKLTSLDLSSFDTSNVTNMYNMFEYCNKLTSLDLSSFDTSNVTNMNYMFSNCEKLETISNIDISKVDSMSSMFRYCYKLKNLTLKGKPTSSLTIPTSTFNGAGRDAENPILYYPSEFADDYQKIINALPSKWAAVPY